jgi:hypothetical protein
MDKQDATVTGVVDEDRTAPVAPVPVERWPELVRGRIDEQRPPGYRSIAELLRDPRQVGGWGDEGQGDLREYMRQVDEDLRR